MIEQNAQIDPNAIDTGKFFVNEELRLSLTTEQLFAAIDLPKSVSLSDLRYEIERAKKVTDPERERQHQERLQKHAAFIEAAQPVLDAYAEDAPPHPQWSTRRLRSVARGAQRDIELYTLDLSRFDECAPGYIHEWKSMYKGVASRFQRHDEYQREIHAKIAVQQGLIDECTAILKARGIEVPA